MNVDRLKAWLALEDERRSLEARLKEIVSQQEALREPLIDQWSEEGVDSLRVDGRTVSLRRQVWARVLDRERIADVLRKEGLETLLTPNSQQLSAWLREREANGEPLPASFDGVVTAYERFSLTVRNGRS